MNDNLLPKTAQKLMRPNTHISHSLTLSFYLKLILFHAAITLQMKGDCCGIVLRVQDKGQNSVFVGHSGRTNCCWIMVAGWCHLAIQAKNFGQVEKGKGFSWRKKSSPCSIMVVFGILIQSHQSHVGVISPDRLLPRAWIMSDHRQMQIRVFTIA